jgi:hypothetical protein
MNFFKPHSITVIVVVLAGGLVSAQTHAASDIKSIGPLGCQPYGPGTTISELIYNQTGISNPGTTNESVICQIQGDAEGSWSSTPGSSANLYVWYRAGSVSGKVACTAYTGSTAVAAGSTYSVAHNPTAVAAGIRDHYTIQLAEVSGAYGAAPPISMICTLTPKAILGTIFVEELVVTNTP